jgi:2,4-dienoyl-CoA reductase (NADPH2)
VDVRLNTRVSAASLLAASPPFDHIVLATGIAPRLPAIPGIAGAANVVSYVSILNGTTPLAHVGKRVAIIGAGGVGFDVAEFLTHAAHAEPAAGALPAQPPLAPFLKEWGIDPTNETRGGLAPDGPQPPATERQVTLLQRSKGKVGAGLGKTTGWIHRAGLKARNVEFLSGVSYKAIDQRGVTVTLAPSDKGRKGGGGSGGGAQERLIEVDTIVICAGQEPNRALHAELLDASAGGRDGPQLHLIGGAEKAGELDAKRAIDQGSRLAAVIETAKSGQVFEAPLTLSAHVYKAVAKRMGAG